MSATIDESRPTEEILELRIVFEYRTDRVLLFRESLSPYISEQLNTHDSVNISIDFYYFYYLRAAKEKEKEKKS